MTPNDENKKLRGTILELKCPVFVVKFCLQVHLRAKTDFLIQVLAPGLVIR